MTRLRRYEVHVRLRLRVIAEDEEQAAQVVAEDVATPIVATVQGLHAMNARLAGWSLHADDVVEELEA
jgi:succinyl-CoA synthetase alpha subunit